MRKTVKLKHDRIDERQFILTVTRLADSLSFGGDPSPFLGAGMEYMQSRQYVPGDPVKTIDWRVTARTGKVFVKEYEVPKRMPIYLLLDTSASMCVSHHHTSKYSWAVMLATGLALAGQERLSPVGILGCGERDLHLSPTFSRNEILRTSQQLRNHNFIEKTTLGEGLRQLTPSLGNRCLVIVLSDLHDPDSLPALKLIAQKHDCIVLQLQDPAEAGKVGGGIFRAREAETGASFVGHGRKRWFRGLETGKELRKAGADHLLLRTDEVFLPKLRRFLRMRDRFGGES